MGSVLVSSSVLYFLVVKNCNGSENMSQKKVFSKKGVFCLVHGIALDLLQFSISMH